MEEENVKTFRQFRLKFIAPEIHRTCDFLGIEDACSREK
jgi:hypothetical protein